MTTPTALLSRAYPRLRGEHFDGRVWIIHDAGLPPPSRGAQKFGLSHEDTSGPTPAFAGSTLAERHARRQTVGLPPPSRGAQASWT